MSESEQKRNNRRFNSKFLHETFLSLPATLIGVEGVALSVYTGDWKKSTIIDFACSCGTIGRKKFENIAEYGALCEGCTIKKKVARIQASKKASLPLEKSFVSHPQFRFFVRELNPEIDPRRIGIQSAEPLTLKCPDCLHIFPGKAHGLRNCRFCEHQELCDNDDCIMCFGNSLASRHFANIALYKEFKTLLAAGGEYESLITLFLKSCAIYDFKNNKECCRSLFKSTRLTVCLFICHKCDHSFPSQPCRVEKLIDCPFCSPENAKMLCPKEKNCTKCFTKSFASHPKAEFWDYSEDKNDGKTPHDVFLSGSHMADVVCGDCKRSFQSLCNNIFTGFWCPYCNNKTEGKMNDYLQTIPQLVFQRQYRPDWLYNPITKNYAVFDFVDLTIKTIIELDGDQHFRNITHWRSTAEDNRKKDLNKMLIAFTQGFSGLRIYQVDVWEDKQDWRVWVVAALNLIKSESVPIWVFPKQTIYENHIDECKKQGIRYIVL